MDNFLWQWNKDYPEESENINDSDGLCEYRSPEECAQEIIEKFNSLDWDPDSDDVEDQVIYQENLDEIQKAIKECEKELKNKKDKETFRNLIRQWWEDNDKNNIVDEALTNDTVVIKPKEIEKKEKTEKEKFEESWNKIDPENSKEENEKVYEIMQIIGKNRGCLVSGGNIDDEKVANIILEDFRSGKIGKITLEKAGN